MDWLEGVEESDKEENYMTWLMAELKSMNICNAVLDTMVEEHQVITINAQKSCLEVDQFTPSTRAVDRGKNNNILCVPKCSGGRNGQAVVRTEVYTQNCLEQTLVEANYNAEGTWWLNTWVKSNNFSSCQGKKPDIQKYLYTCKNKLGCCCVTVKSLAWAKSSRVVQTHWVDCAVGSGISFKRLRSAKPRWAVSNHPGEGGSSTRRFLKARRRSRLKKLCAIHTVEVIPTTYEDWEGEREMEHSDLDRQEDRRGRRLSGKVKDIVGKIEEGEIIPPTLCPTQGANNNYKSGGEEKEKRILRGKRRGCVQQLVSKFEGGRGEQQQKIYSYFSKSKETRKTFPFEHCEGGSPLAKTSAVGDNNNKKRKKRKFEEKSNIKSWLEVKKHRSEPGNGQGIIS